MRVGVDLQRHGSTRGRCDRRRRVAGDEDPGSAVHGQHKGPSRACGAGQQGGSRRTGKKHGRRTGWTLDEDTTAALFFAVHCRQCRGWPSRIVRRATTGNVEDTVAWRRGGWDSGIPSPGAEHCFRRAAVSSQGTRAARPHLERDDLEALLDRRDQVLAPVVEIHWCSRIPHAGF